MRKRKLESSYRTLGRMRRALRRDFRPDVLEWMREVTTFGRVAAYEAASGQSWFTGKTK